MATANEVTVTAAGVALTLTVEEAQFLRDILHCGVGGDPVNSRRRHSDAINDALEFAGVATSVGYQAGEPQDFTGVLNF